MEVGEEKFPTIPYFDLAPPSVHCHKCGEKKTVELFRSLTLSNGNEGIYSLMSLEKSAKESNVSHYNIKQKRSVQTDKRFNVFKQIIRMTAISSNS
jgi:hypothetical protein